VFQSRVVRRKFGPNRDEIIRGGRRLHNEELRNFYSSPNIVKIITSTRMRWAEHVARMRTTSACRHFVGKHMHRYEDNIKIYLREIGWGLWAGFIWLRIRASGGLLRTL
jgi:hypothetical protein